MDKKTTLGAALKHIGDQSPENLPLVRTLLEAGADPQKVLSNPDSVSGLVELGRPQELELVFNYSHIHPDSVKGPDGRSMFQMAFDRSHSPRQAEIALALLRCGASLSPGFPYLHLTADPELLQYLLETRGLSSTKTNKKKQSPLQCLLQSKQCSTEAIRILLNHGAHVQELPLCHPDIVLAPDLVSQLLSLGHDPNEQRAKDGKTPLILCASLMKKYDHKYGGDSAEKLLETIQLLVQGGARSNDVPSNLSGTNACWSALHHLFAGIWGYFSSSQTDVEIDVELEKRPTLRAIRFLISRGGAVPMRDRWNRTPLMCLNRNDDYWVLRRRLCQLFYENEAQYYGISPAQYLDALRELLRTGFTDGDDPEDLMGDPHSRPIPGKFTEFWNRFKLPSP